VSPLKVLFLSMEYPPETGGGGIGSYVATVAPALVARGHEVHVLSCVSRQPPSDTMDRDVWIHRRPQIRVKGSSRLLGRMWPETVPRILTAISTFVHYRRLGIRFDVIEGPEWMAEGLFLTRTRPFVTHLHTPIHLTARHNGQQMTRDVRIADRLERLSVRRAAIVTTPSQLLVRRLARSGWLNGRPPRLVRNPVDLELWTSCASVARTTPAVLAVGRLEALKSPETLVDAAEKLAPIVPELEVIFVGRSNGSREGQEYRRWLEDRARRNGAPCRFVESVPRAGLLDWYGKARVVALPSRFDNFPMVGLESMAAGRAVVCTSETGLAELVAGSGAGTVVPPGHPEALAAALRPYLVDRSVAVRAGQTAREIVVEQCAPAAVAEEREGCYLEAIERWKLVNGKAH
jgi:glycogen synthase